MNVLDRGRIIKCLICLHDFTKECVTLTAAYGISGVLVTHILDCIALFCGDPAKTRTDQETVTTCRAPAQSAFEHGCQASRIKTDF